jgi:aspartate carbamoyltransferase regulatory subunit
MSLINSGQLEIDLRASNKVICDLLKKTGSERLLKSYHVTHSSDASTPDTKNDLFRCPYHNVTCNNKHKLLDKMRAMEKEKGVHL